MIPPAGATSAQWAALWQSVAADQARRITDLERVALAAQRMRAVLRPLHDYCDLTDQRRREVLEAMRAYDLATHGRPQPRPPAVQ